VDTETRVRYHGERLLERRNGLRCHGRLASGRRAGREITYSADLPDLLGRDREWRSDKAKSDNGDKSPPVH
jgi:hypothetical protein